MSLSVFAGRKSGRLNGLLRIRRGNIVLRPWRTLDEVRNKCQVESIKRGMRSSRPFRL